jgi:hypothetical protein
MSAFVKLMPKFNRQLQEPAVTIGRMLYINKPAQDLANMHVMKSIEVFWDEEKRILMLKPNHQVLAGAFSIRRPNPSTCMIACPDVLKQRGKSKCIRIHVPATWVDKEKAFYVRVEKGSLET